MWVQWKWCMFACFGGSIFNIWSRLHPHCRRLVVNVMGRETVLENHLQTENWEIFNLLVILIDLVSNSSLKGGMMQKQFFSLELLTCYNVLPSSNTYLELFLSNLSISHRLFTPSQLHLFPCALLILQNLAKLIPNLGAPPSGPAVFFYFYFYYYYFPHFILRGEVSLKGLGWVCTK